MDTRHDCFLGRHNATRPVFHFDLKRKITGLSSFPLKLQLHQKKQVIGPNICNPFLCVYTFVFITLLLVEVKQKKVKPKQH